MRQSNKNIEENPKILKKKKKSFSFPYLNNVLYILAQYSSKNIARTY